VVGIAIDAKRVENQVFYRLFCNFCCKSVADSEKMRIFVAPFNTMVE